MSWRIRTRIISTTLGWAVASSAVAADVDFNRDIRPILSQNCFQCHGPDAAARKADLRLDQRGAAIADLGGYAPIVPGKSAESEIIARILDTDPQEKMPPAKTKKQCMRLNRFWKFHRRI